MINTVSEAGLYGGTGQANYAAAKAGIAGMTIALARELKNYGVTVNAIAPRARTRMTETVLGDYGAAPKAMRSTSGTRRTSDRWSRGSRVTMPPT